MEEHKQGTGVLTSEQTGASWTVNYDITYRTDLMTVRPNMPPVTRWRASVVVGHDARVTYPDGGYTLQAIDELVSLQRSGGQWHVVSGH
jgi:hypothetical protein